MEILKTSRLILRTWTINDLEDGFNIWGDIEVMKYVDSGQTLTLEQVKKSIESALNHQEKFGFQHWAVIEKKTGKLIGACGFNSTEDTGVIELVFHFSKFSWGKGYATEAAKACVAYAFKKIKLTKIIAGCHPQNEASKKVLTNCGFSFIGNKWFDDTQREEPCFELQCSGDLDMETVIVETPRLILRKFIDSDLEPLIPIMGDPDVQRFSKFGVEDSTGIQKFLDGVKMRDARDGVTQYAIILRQTGELVGDCGIMVQNVDGISEFEIGYKLAKKFWGHGYATEAAISCRDYGINKLGIRRFVSIIDPANVPSIKVAQRVGMVLEKRSFYGDSTVDIYSLKVTDKATQKS